MTNKLRPYLLLAAGLLLFCASVRSSAGSVRATFLADKGEDVQRTVTRTLALPVTRIDSVSFNTVKVTEYKGTPKPEFKLVEKPLPPFQLVDAQNKPILLNEILMSDAEGIVPFRVAFRPTTPGFHRATIRAQRRTQPGNVLDEIVINLQGHAFIPLRAMHVDFGTIITGDSVERLVRMTPEVAAVSAWKIVEPEPPFYVDSGKVRRVQDPDNTGETVHAFVLHFKPIVKGLKKGQVTFIRQRSINDTLRVIDTLIVTLSGNAEELNIPVTAIPLIRLMVGDIAVRDTTVEIRGRGKTYYKPIHQPGGDSPFRLLSYEFQKDVFHVRASYAPVEATQLPIEDTATIVFYRYARDSGEPLDALVFTLSGVATVMQPTEASVDFVDQRIGQVDSQDVHLTIPVKFDTRSFSYVLKMEPNRKAFDTALVIVPAEMPSQERDIHVRVYSKPKMVGRYTDDLVVERTHDISRVADKTVISVTSVVRPREVKFRASIERETLDANNKPVYSEDDVISARIGDTVVVAVRANTSDPIDIPLDVNTIRCSLAYNPTVLVPLVTPGDETLVVSDSTVFAFGGETPTSNAPIRESGQVLARASFVVVMGDADHSALTMTSLTLRPDTLIQIPELDNATVRITNVWNYQDGRSRLINPFQDPLVLDVAPNPTTPDTRITFDNVPQGLGKLQIVSSDGTVVADFTDQLRNGAAEFAFPTSLPRGVYFVRLMAVAQSDGSGTASVSSVVRLVVVE